VQNLLRALQKTSEEVFEILSDFLSDIPRRFVQYLSESSAEKDPLANLFGKFCLEVKNTASPRKKVEGKFHSLLVEINASLRKFIPK